MKLANEMPYVLDRMLKLDKDSVKAYEHALRAEGAFKCFDVRFANDVLRACVPCDKVCSWYKEYGCDDNNITTLAINACKKIGWL